MASCWPIFRKIVGTVVWLACFTLVVYGISKGYAVMPGPPWLLFLILIFVVTLLAYLEGLQVSCLSLQGTHYEHYAATHPRGLKAQKLVDQKDHMARFLIGRQFFVIFVVFVCALITTLKELPELGLPNWLFVVIFQSGLPGALTVLAVGQLMPQLMATKSPMTICNLLGAYQVLWLCLVLESLGIADFSWVITGVVQRLCNVKDAPVPVSGHGHGHHHTSSDSMAMTITGTPSASPLLPEASAFNSADWDDEHMFVLDSKTIQEEDLAAWAQQGLDSVKTTGTDTNGNTTAVPSFAMLSDWSFSHNADRYPGPSDIVRHLMSERSDKAVSIPRFLLPPTHPQHIPPHLVAFHLMQRMAQLRVHVSNLVPLGVIASPALGPRKQHMGTAGNSSNSSRVAPSSVASSSSSSASKRDTAFLTVPSQSPTTEQNGVSLTISVEQPVSPTSSAVSTSATSTAEVSNTGANETGTVMQMMQGSHHHALELEHKQ